MYWYVPLIGLSIAVSAIASRMPREVTALFFILWLPSYYALLREKRREILSGGDATRRLVADLQDYQRRIPTVRAVVFDNLQERIGTWGVCGAVDVIFGHGVDCRYAGDPGAKQAMSEVPMALISFQRPFGIDGIIRTRDGPSSHLRFTEKFMKSQLVAGWYDVEGTWRWIAPRTEVDLYRPPDASGFEIVTFLPKESIRKDGPASVTVFEDGLSLGVMNLSEPRIQTLRWKLAGGAPGDKRIRIVIKPVRHDESPDPRDLGLPVVAIGYVP